MRASAFIVLLMWVGLFLIMYNLGTMKSHEYLVNSPTKQIDPVIHNPIKTKSKTYHIAMTASDTPYSQWQSRIMYYWFKKKKQLPMGNFTRVLHSEKPDNLMDEIPTFLVDPLPPGYDMGYVVLNRPWAFIQWLELSKIEEDYILMAEPDHIFLKPLPNLAYEDYPAGYPFFYIKPDKRANIIRKFYPEEMGPLTNIDPIGNSPVIIRKDLLKIIAPTWMNISVRMKSDPETDKAFGWVLEMYAYAVASALHGVQHILRKEFQLQPPWDLETANIYILHYTYALDYNSKGELTFGKPGVWGFNKRFYLDGPPPRNLSLPPSGAPESVVTFVKMMNEATANLPNWDATQ
ncbi:Unknown protein [Striga hermonthica]|uniref:Hydroxyproline O-arabinosyltransferase-like domain-containing protein n=1 Tax=Striga hermonthica TaxID=68872 RepID=A0A9N7RRA5_STRHE|nr:Unknown protein [Striga hermonthica]